MDTRQAIEKALLEAMRNNDETAKRTLRLVLSSIKLADVEKGIRLDEAGVIAVIQKEIKSHRESILDAEKANRPDLADANQAGIVILESFLPKQLSDDELTGLVNEALAETGAKTPADMGKVMKALMPRVQGRVAGDRVSQVVRKLLAG
jgi:uncharacterized protein YqeY